MPARRFIYRCRARGFLRHHRATRPQGSFALHGVKDLRIGWSRAAGDKTLATADGMIL